MPVIFPAQRPTDEGPPRIEWAQYVAATTKDYAALLAGDPDEAAMQDFFERHPALAPGAFPHGIGHGAFPEALISQPDLRGIGHRRPDLMWIARSSAEVQPVLIELERPGKRWLAGGPRDIRPSMQLNQATNQLRQWREWFDRPANQSVFYNNFGVPPEWQRLRALRPQYWLFIGRRDENPEEIAKLRAEYARQGMQVHTYDNLRAPNEWCKDYITVRAVLDGTYRALHVPPTIGWIASSPTAWRAVSGRTEAVRAADGMSAERRAFLVEQIAVWDEWAAAWP